MDHSYEYGPLVPLLGRKTLVAKVIGGELQATEMDDAAGARPTTVKLLPLATKESFGEGTIRMFRGKAG
jgi:hypothetical protein